MSPLGMNEPHNDKHCFATTDPTTTCLQSCQYFYSGNYPLSNCEGKLADYQYVEYQCIPTNSPIISPNTPCPADGAKVTINIDRKGRFQSYNYPILQTMNCAYRLVAKPGEIINVYSLEVSMEDFATECTSNKLILIEDGETDGLEICEKRTHSLLYASCSNEIDLFYNVTDANRRYSKGAELYIEAEVRSSEWACGKPIETTPLATTPTLPLTTPTSRPITTSSADMGASAELEYDICLGKTLNERCATGYTFIIVGAYYGVKKQASNICGFTQGDCVQETLASITACQNDVPGCFVSYSTKRRLALCADNEADYLHITGQCIPSDSITGGAQIDKYDICETTDDIMSFTGIIRSPGFPRYGQTKDECKRTLIGPTESILKLWINEMSVAASSVRSLSGKTIYS